MYYVYILTNRTNKVLYTGITSNIERRLLEHKNHLIAGFTSKYNIHKLVFLETFSSSIDAIGAEEKIKGWIRSKKIALIETTNPAWKDLSEK